MSESESWRIQISPKCGDMLVNLRAETPDELDYLISAVEERAAAIAGLVSTLSGVGVLGKNAAPASQQPSQPQAWGSTSGPSGQDSSPTSGASGKTCKHGEMVRRTGNKNGRDWVGYFCPTPKGTPDQCKAIFG